MRRQRNMPQVKEEEKSSEKEVNEMESSNLPDIELKRMGIRLLKELKGRMDELSENLRR